MIDHPAIFKKALQFYSQGNLNQAKSICQTILKADGAHVEALHLLGVIALQAGEYQAAIMLLKSALQNCSHSAQIHNNIGQAYERNKTLSEAVRHYQKAIDIDPHFFMAYYNLGNVFNGMQQSALAQKMYLQAVASNPDFFSAHYKLGVHYFEQGQMQEAKKHFEKTLQINPRFYKAHNNLGYTFKNMGDYDHALKHLNRAIDLQPDFIESYGNRALIHLLLGNFEKGWLDFQWRESIIKKNNPPPTGVSRWDGKSFHNRKLLVLEEQGFGDTIQFIRYLPLVKKLGGDVYFRCHPAIQPLLKGNENIDGFWEKEEEKYDAYIYLLSLPGIFNATELTIPVSIPYIIPFEDMIVKWEKHIPKSNHFKIGVVWSGNPKNPNDQNRSCNPELFEPLFDFTDVQIIGLQKTDKNTPFPERHFLNIGNMFNDFSDTAGALTHFDLIISVDTSVAHLAGAVGIPVWTMIPFVPDWRWQLNSQTTIWYPTMRLFRQSRMHDWSTVVKDICIALKKIVG